MNNDFLIVGISGPIAVGKSHLALWLRNVLNKNLFVDIVPFARVVKQIAAIQNEVVLEEYKASKIASIYSRVLDMEKAYEATALTLQAFKDFPTKGNEKNRRLLQTIGGEIGRKIDPNIWVNFTRTSSKFRHVVIADDLRYPNEAEMCDIHIKIVPNILYEHRVTGIRTAHPEYLYDDHESEKQILPEPNITIEAGFTNIDTIVDLVYIKLKEKGISYE